MCALLRDTISNVIDGMNNEDNEPSVRLEYGNELLNRIFPKMPILLEELGETVYVLQTTRVYSTLELLMAAMERDLGCHNGIGKYSMWETVIDEERGGDECII